MHELLDERNTLPSAATSQKDCIGCGRALQLICFRRDSSYRDGHRDMCEECESSPRLSTAEHVDRLRERNYSSEGVKNQRWANQEDFYDEYARIGRRLTGREFYSKLSTIAKNLYVTEGRIIGDLAIFKTYGCPQPHLSGNSFEYICYMPTGIMPEYSTMEFDDKDVPVREKQRGWRTVLLRLIKARIITEQQCEEVFGPAEGAASTRWRRELFGMRSGK